MINISATSLRGKLFEILKRVESGEQIVVTHNKKKVAYLSPIKKHDWRNQLSEKPKLLVPPDEIIKPVTDIWEGYI
ncbi:type II toxin-antitoxin system Phd/YefM family antitoxin [Desulfobacter latus]|uniref:Antitoxin n=1 Tax=Desulfobacter latus TaxID=2292 RepID=A0A850SZU1_9BACT|nr:type II toxin-antitoxin system prevent-host-death family antitoxin [Desulfobacter latus]NWH06789.1 type II toxin-antitoxin system prevent-host-death family antitoxin [Desulfobacter latus]